MIDYNPKSWFKVILTFHKSGTVRKFWKELILIGLFTAAMTFIELKYFKNHPAIAKVGDFHSFLGLAFSLLLVFRINSAYDKWWEGRKLWGRLVNETRNMATKFSVFLPKEATVERKYVQTLIENYPFALKEHLRDNMKWEELEEMDGLIAHLQTKKHVPNEISRLLYEFAMKLKKEGKMSEEEFLSIDKEIKALSDVLGGCERIKKTPIPYSYSLFLKKFIFIFISTAPIGFIPAMEYYTIPVAIVIFYVFVSLEYIAEEIEDPFGLDANDLPTDRLAKTIKANVTEIFNG
ncbi:MAG: bestrophin family ion channel [Crocinitomicaceae bacterium]